MAVERKSKARLTYGQRQKIKEMMDSSVPVTKIAAAIGVHRSTIYNELKRNSDGNGQYEPDSAQAKYEGKMQKMGTKTILEQHPEMAAFIADKILNEGRSPENIAALIAGSPDNFQGVTVGTKTIYSAIDRGLIPGVTRENLNTAYVKMFSNGLLRLPAWAMEKTGFKDGDKFTVDISVDGQILFKKNDGK